MLLQDPPTILKLIIGRPPHVKDAPRCYVTYALPRLISREVAAISGVLDQNLVWPSAPITQTGIGDAMRMAIIIGMMCPLL